MSAQHEQADATDAENDFGRDFVAVENAARAVAKRRAPRSPRTAPAAVAYTARLSSAPRRHIAAAASRQQQQRAPQASTTTAAPPASGHARAAPAHVTQCVRDGRAHARP